MQLAPWSSKMLQAQHMMYSKTPKLQKSIRLSRWQTRAQAKHVRSRRTKPERLIVLTGHNLQVLQ